MNPQIITKAIQELSPTAEFAFSADDLSSLKWHNAKAPRPTDAEILARCEVVIANLESEATTKAAEKAALLERLGITADEAKLLFA
jgi:hypothetical protein